MSLLGVVHRGPDKVFSVYRMLTLVEKIVLHLEILDFELEAVTGLTLPH